MAAVRGSARKVICPPKWTIVSEPQSLRKSEFSHNPVNHRRGCRAWKYCSRVSTFFVLLSVMDYIVTVAVAAAGGVTTRELRTSGELDAPTPRANGGRG